MASFQIAYTKYVQPNEGFFADLLGDRGKITYGGISYVLHPDWKGWPIIKQFIESKGGQFISGKTGLKNNTRIPAVDPLVTEFFNDWWNRLHLGLIKSQDVANIFFDWIVNSEFAAPKGVQKIVGVSADGVIGSNTIEAINKMNPAKLNNAIKEARKAYYLSIAGNGDNSNFINQWLDRLNRFPNLTPVIIGLSGLSLLVIIVILFIVFES